MVKEKGKLIHYSLPTEKVKTAELEIASLKWGIYDGRVVTRAQLDEAGKILISLGYKELQAQSALKEQYRKDGVMTDWAVKTPDWSSYQNFQTRLFRIKAIHEAKVLTILRPLYPAQYDRIELGNYNFIAYLGLINLEKRLTQCGGKFEFLPEKVS